MTSLVDAAISRARTIVASLLLILVAGFYAYLNVPKEAEPDINIPIIYVSLSLNGISPEDAERLLLKPMEKELTGIEGVKEMRSTAYQGGANVVLEFDAGFNVDTALADVREKGDAGKTELPDTADEPSVNEVNFSLFPVLVITLSGPAPERTLLRLARDLKDKIEALPPVLQAEIAGDREEVLEVIIDPTTLESYGLDATALIEFIARSNRLVAAGSLDNGNGRFAVKVPGLFESYEDILNMPVKVEGDSVVTFRDIAELRRTFKDPTGFARIDGQPAIALEVSKRTGENIIETIESVRALVDSEAARWPAGIDVAFNQDRSKQIRIMLTDLQNNVMSAVLLVMIVIIAALGLRSAGLVGIAIPGSFLTGILILASLGLTINIVVLFSLILAVGMLVDGAIVVTEYADRKMVEGEPRQRAYSLAARRMAWPIIAATATTLAAFLPLMFWPGVVGEFMKFLPLTLIATLSASLVMALIFIPTLGALFGKSATKNRNLVAIAGDHALPLAEIRGFTGRYLRVLQMALNHPGKVLMIALALLIGAQYAYARFGHGVEFFPEIEPDQIAVQIHGRGNLSARERDALVREVEERILDIEQRRGEFHAVYSRSVVESGTQNDEPEDLIGTIQIEFVDWNLRRPAKEIIAEIRELTAPLAGILIEVRAQEGGPAAGKPLQLEVSAENPDQILRATQIIADKVKQLDGVVDIEDGLPVPCIEWQLDVDRAQAAKFDIDVSLIGSYVRLVTNGMQLGEYRPDDSDDELDILARFPERYRRIGQLDLLRIQSNAGLVPLSNFVSRTAKPKVGILRRVDRDRVMTVKADVAPGVLADDKVQELKGVLQEVNFEPGVTVSFKGEDEEQQKAKDFLSKAFIVALFLMAIILLTQFNSFYSAALILTAVIMSTIGVMIGLLVMNQPFGIVMSGIGVIALAGIVVNNNIVLIDTFDRLKKTAPTIRDAILQSGAQRLRPVLLTTVTTILGLMPMVLGLNIDFFSREVSAGAPSTQWWRQLSSAIVFGLSFATLLTLLVTPAALMLRENLAAFWRRRKKRPVKESTATAEGREIGQPAE
jgi:multidrug efflux pump